jgi:hypothetical protein
MVRYWNGEKEKIKKPRNKKESEQFFTSCSGSF